VTCPCADANKISLSKDIFVWQAFLPKEKKHFATWLMISVMKKFNNSNIDALESRSSLWFSSVCLYVLHADSDQILMSSIENFLSGRLLKGTVA
jgi:hypothetical protein